MLRVLVVDDNEEFRDGIAEVLADRGAEVATAGDGVQALAILAHEPPPHLVLLDLWMPNLDGRAVLARIRADQRLAEVRVIVLTAVEGEELGVPTLHKPFSVERFLDLVTAMMGEPAGTGARPGR